ncbi:hypothetical protein [Burkholderia anthina]|uniref:hypothetical protein n=1 Tax=Burkholderia anthina TaxID=179879 RepID=UPI00158EB326|nr:hypothetical protein [Burkholderia anthina]
MAKDDREYLDKRRRGLFGLVRGQSWGIRRKCKKAPKVAPDFAELSKNSLSGA